MKPVLIINSGSSSLKYQVIDLDSQQSLLTGLIERVVDHTKAIQQLFDQLVEQELENIVAVGHRVVHGGKKFSDSVVINNAVIAEIESLVPLAPLHNPGNLSGIKAAMAHFDIPQIAVFDTAFHQSMPASSYSYAIDSDLAQSYDIRKYGFHGTSHSFVSRVAADVCGIPLTNFNAISLHLGNGASACAIKNGKSFDTSMGLTPLPGLVMGTRSGDIDPAVIFYLHASGMSISEIDESLNRDSGLKGISGFSDFRDVLASDEPKAKLALQVFYQRIRQYVGGYLAVLGGADAVIFTAGVGENSSVVRESVVSGLAHLGIELDGELNNQTSNQPRVISTASSKIKVLVIPTNEEREIALEVQRLIAN